jgi:hypothetical protein
VLVARRFGIPGGFLVYRAPKPQSATDYTHLWVLEFVVDSEQFTRITNPQPLEGKVDWF